MNEETNRPSRYMLPAGLEVIDVIQHVLPNIVGQDATKYGVAQAIRYMLRLGRKDGVGVVTDLKKARWYLDEAIRLEGGESWNPEPRPMAQKVLGE
jgi:hypothetical protein